ncbi:MAG TPA: hypothetical protein VIJ93_05315 [bacterium]
MNLKVVDQYHFGLPPHLLALQTLLWHAIHYGDQQPLENLNYPPDLNNEVTPQAKARSFDPLQPLVILERIYNDSVFIVSMTLDCCTSSFGPKIGPPGTHSSPGLKAWGFLARFIKIKKRPKNDQSLPES